MKCSNCGRETDINDCGLCIDCCCGECDECNYVDQSFDDDDWIGKHNIKKDR